jgi:hypothetical protein
MFEQDSRSQTKATWAFSVSYEFDLFGKLRRGVEAANADTAKRPRQPATSRGSPWSRTWCVHTSKTARRPKNWPSRNNRWRYRSSAWTFRGVCVTPAVAINRT